MKKQHILLVTILCILSCALGASVVKFSSSSCEIAASDNSAAVFYSIPRFYSTIERQRIMKKEGVYKGDIDGLRGTLTIDAEKEHAKLYNDQHATRAMREGNDMYVIKWKSKLTGKTGQGATPFKKWDAAEQVARLNRQYPDIEHWYEPSTESFPVASILEVE